MRVPCITNHNRIMILRILRQIAHNAVCEGLLVRHKSTRPPGSSFLNGANCEPKQTVMDADLKEAKGRRGHNFGTNFQLRSRRTFDRGANWPVVRATVLGQEAEPHNKSYCNGNAGSMAFGNAVRLFGMLDGRLSLSEPQVTVPAILGAG